MHYTAVAVIRTVRSPRLEELRQELEKEKEQLKYAQQDTRTVGAVGRRLVPVVEIVRSSGVKRGKRA